MINKSAVIFTLLSSLVFFQSCASLPSQAVTAEPQGKSLEIPESKKKSLESSIQLFRFERENLWIVESGNSIYVLDDRDGELVFAVKTDSYVYNISDVKQIRRGIYGFPTLDLREEALLRGAVKPPLDNRKLEILACVIATRDCFSTKPENVKIRRYNKYPENFGLVNYAYSRGVTYSVDPREHVSYHSLDHIRDFFYPNEVKKSDLFFEQIRKASDYFDRMKEESARLALSEKQRREKERAEERIRFEEKEKMIDRQAVSMRKSIAIGTQTNCGPVFELRLPMVGVQTRHGPQYIRLSELFGPMADCKFIDTVYSGR